MAITVVTRPIGHKLSVTPHTAVVNQGYGGTDASFIEIGHGLTDGDYIYAESLIEEYNGFFYVDSITGDNFKLKEGPGADPVEWVANGTITYYVSTLDHGWSCVHLPIVYKLSNDLWPINTVDTERTVSSFTDVNGYTNLNLSGALKATVVDLDYVKISGAANDELNGVWQIIDAVSTSDVTINLAYDAAYSFSGATVQFYYHNYHLRVKVFGGLSSDHQYEYLKPYRELAELRLIPDSDGQVMFSINEILKALINTRNNLLLASLPCNIDFFTQFYISYAESYDESDGSEVTTNVSAYVSDQDSFEGYAVNSKLAFKNMYSGYLTEYLMSLNTTAAKFLTLFTTGVLFSGCINEVDFIFENTSTNNIIDGNSGYQQTNDAGYADWDTETRIVSIEPGSNPSNYLYKASGLLEGSTYRMNFNIAGAGTYTTTIPGNPLFVNIVFLDSDLNYISGETLLSASGSSTSVNSSIDVTIPTNTAYIAFNAIASGSVSTGGFTVTINEITFEASNVVVREEKYLDGILIATENTAISGESGLFRHFITVSEDYDQYLVSVHTDENSVTPISEVFTFDVDSNCAQQEICLTWLNNLGGFDHWNFQAKKDHIVEITETGITKQNIFPSWPQSYGSIADTIRKQTFRTSNKAFTIRSQHLTQDQVDALSFIKSSVLVQILNSRQDRRTVILDDGAFVIRKDGDDTYSISFNISYTDDIPVQRV